METNRAASTQTTLRMYGEFSEAFTGTGCFESTFSLEDKDDTKPYQVQL